MLAKDDTGAKEGRGEGRRKADSQGTQSSMSRTEIPRGPYWLLMREQDRLRDGHAELDGAGSRHGGSREGMREGVFLMEAGTEKVLPVFCSEEAADLFLDSCGEGGYRKRRTWAAELLSVLSASAYSGPCAGVQKVVLDPPQESADGSKEGLACMDRRCFQEHLMGRGAGWFWDKESRA